MIIERNETPQELAFTLTLPQLRQAHEIYKKHCFFQDFMECCEERRTEETGLCNLPYQTLEHETDILCKAYECFILGKHTARNGVAGISPLRREFQKC